jgi:hypothetical protein
MKLLMQQHRKLFYVGKYRLTGLQSDVHTAICSGRFVFSEGQKIPYSGKILLV